MAFRVTGFPDVTDYSHLFEQDVFPDSAHERATAWEAVWGNPYRPLTEIMQRHGYEDWVVDGTSPRPPSTLLLQTPLLLIPTSVLMPFASVATVALLMWIGWLALRIGELTGKQMLWAIPFLLLSLPVMDSMLLSPVFALLAVALLLVSWRYQDRPWAGVLLGMSAALRLWPGLVIIAFWLNGRRRLARNAVLTFVVLSLAGLMLPGVTLTGSIESLIAAKGSWLNHNMNSSLALVLWPYGVAPIVSVAVASGIGIWLAARNKPHAVPIAILAALLASPLSWPIYALAALPVFALYARRESPLPVLALAVAVASWSLWPPKWFGHLHFAVLVVMLVLVALPRMVDLTRQETLSPGRDLALERL
jgi:hypothetical protein